MENIVQYINNPAKLNSLPDNRLATFYKDKYGIIWIASAGKVTQFDPNSNQFQFDHIGTSGKNTNQAIIRSISGLPDNNSKIVIGTNTEGLLTYNFDSKNISKIKFKDSAYKIDSSNTINDLDIDYTGNNDQVANLRLVANAPDIWEALVAGNAIMGCGNTVPALALGISSPLDLYTNQTREQGGGNEREKVRMVRLDNGFGI